MSFEAVYYQQEKIKEIDEKINQILNKLNEIQYILDGFDILFSESLGGGLLIEKISASSVKPKTKKKKRSESKD